MLTHTEPFAGFMQSNVRPLEESTNSPLINNWLGMCTVMLFTSMSTYEKQNKYTILSNKILLLSRKWQFILLAASFYLVSHCTRIWMPQPISKPQTNYMLLSVDFARSLDQSDILEVSLDSIFGAQSSKNPPPFHVNIFFGWCSVLQ